jgi:hypothetical protein
MVQARTTNREYSDIAREFGVHVQVVRYACRKAMRDGLVTAEQIYHTPQIRKPVIASSQYEVDWILRILENCEITADGCWLWKGWKTRKGYGGTTFKSTNVAIHRKMFELTRGVALTTEQLVCHKCDHRACCNPGHLWDGTAGSNNFDSASKGRHRNQQKTECPKGHPYDAENTYIAPNGARNCKACQRETQKAKYHANREIHNARNRMYRQRRKERETQSV